jgi:hypothetical protein
MCRILNSAWQNQQLQGIPGGMPSDSIFAIVVAGGSMNAKGISETRFW